MSLRTPLGQVLGRGSAKRRYGAFLDSAYRRWGYCWGLWFAFARWRLMPGFAHADALAFIGAPLNGVLLVLLVVTTGYHSSLGRTGCH